MPTLFFSSLRSDIATIKLSNYSRLIMTINVSLVEANNQFLDLIQRIKAGEEVLVSESGISIARIIPIYNQLPRVPGQDKGKIFISPNFNDPLPSDILDGFLSPADPQL
jgi:antitoxin (DNA-binding transcriptional repressor) of toxin-antitoxin stability system